VKLPFSLGSSQPVRPAGGANVCLQCGMAAASAEITFCRRCGLPFGAQPRADVALPSCPVCYQTVGDDGRLPSHHRHLGRVDLVAHMGEHDQFPVGDDDLLESMRVGDRIRIGRFEAPYDLVRRYLVTGALDGGRRRSFQHSAIVNAMAQLGRWGADAEVFGDQPEWREARQVVSDLMERYNRPARLSA
jgi:hypothetical protein